MRAYVYVSVLFLSVAPSYQMSAVMLWQQLLNEIWERVIVTHNFSHDRSIVIKDIKPEIINISLFHLNSLQKKGFS